MEPAEAAGGVEGVVEAGGMAGEGVDPAEAAGG